MCLNNKVPQVNKDSVKERYSKLEHCCIDSIRAWVADTCSSPNFALLQPVMAELAPAVTESVFTTAEAMHTARSLDAGKLMEVAAVQVRLKCGPCWAEALPGLPFAMIQSSIVLWL